MKAVGIKNKQMNMKEKTVTTSKGRLSWVIPVLEFIVIIAYLVIGFGGIMDAFKSFDFAGMFKSVETAIWFLVIATVVITVLCFLPPFKSKANKRIAIWNIIWLAFTIYSLI